MRRSAEGLREVRFTERFMTGASSRRSISTTERSSVWPTLRARFGSASDSAPPCTVVLLVESVAGMNQTVAFAKPRAVMSREISERLADVVVGHNAVVGQVFSSADADGSGFGRLRLGWRQLAQQDFAWAEGFSRIPLVQTDELRQLG